jgi:1-acyl-sn-glycerol-3-phosphate acyltransferase
LGGIRAELDDFEAALAQKTILLYPPEGLRGPRKGWRRRYQLETFDLSFIRLSDRYQIPILPVVCLGNELLHPWAFNIKKLAKQFQLPFLPISILIPVFVLFPSMGVWAMRSRLRYFIQPLYQTESTAATNAEQIQAQKFSLREERAVTYRQAQAFREKLQNQISQLFSS